MSSEFVSQQSPISFVTSPRYEQNTFVFSKQSCTHALLSYVSKRYWAKTFVEQRRDDKRIIVKRDLYKLSSLR